MSRSCLLKYITGKSLKTFIRKLSSYFDIKNGNISVGKIQHRQSGLHEFLIKYEQTQNEFETLSSNKLVLEDFKWKQIFQIKK